MSTEHPKRNLIGVGEDQLLWRVYSVQWLLELLATKKNVLVSPSKWEDPFENILARCTGKLHGQFISLGSLTTGVFGQCWTDQSVEADATWQNYAPGAERGIRVRVKAGELLDTIYRKDEATSAVSCFLGKVGYWAEPAICNWLNNLSVSGHLLVSDPRPIIETLLLKRQEFEHESEVRLLYMDPTNSMRSQQVLPVNCVPSELIQEMLLDPRSTISEATTVRRRIQCLGYRKKVTQSKLYQTP